MAMARRAGVGYAPVEELEQSKADLDLVGQHEANVGKGSCLGL